MSSSSSSRPWRRSVLWLALAAIAAYVLRFLSSALVLNRVGPDRFDPHGFGLLGDLMLLTALAVPLLGLLWWILRRYRPGRGLLARASTPGWTALSLVLLLLLGAPTPEQWAALIVLPVNDSWPVLTSALAWFAVTALLRAGAVSPPAPAR